MMLGTTNIKIKKQIRYLSRLSCGVRLFPSHFSSVIDCFVSLRSIFASIDFVSTVNLSSDKTHLSSGVLMSVCSCIVSIIHNWRPTRCNFLVYLFIYLHPISSTCFGRCFRPSSGAFDCIYSFWYSPPMLLPAGVMDDLEIHLVHDTARKQHRWTISESVNTVTCCWWWVKTSPETCRADLIQINKLEVTSCWSSITNSQ